MKTNKKIKVILPSNQNDSYISENNLFLKDISAVSDSDGEAVFHSSVYEEIFDKKRKTSNKFKKRLAIVKISANGKSIYRAFRSVSVSGFTQDLVGLTSSSIRLLSDKDGKNPIKVTVKKGCSFPYYWENSDKAIRISFKLGLFSLFLGVLSIILAVI